MEAVGSGNRARVTKTVEINEVDRRVSVAEGAGGGGRGRNGGQTPVAGLVLLGQDARMLGSSGNRLDTVQEGCSIYVTIRRLLYAKEITFKGKDGSTSSLLNLTRGSGRADTENNVSGARTGGSKG